MKFLDLTLPSPAENLACDEALLDCREAEPGEGVLRFWEPQSHFVVVGYGNRVSLEANRAACEAENIPILRRCSGGGTVLQGPGCLNYSLILNTAEFSQLHTISTANRFVMDRNQAVLDALRRGKHRAGPSLPSDASSIEVRGHTDLAIGELKFSGNAQRRRRRCLLFHGTFLLQFDLSLMEKFLPMPKQQPEYRRHRPHRDFLTNLDLSAAAVKRAMQQAWQARKPLEEIPLEQIASLAREKYSNPEWNTKFE